LAKVRICGIIAQLRLSCFIAAQKLSQLFKTGIHLIVNQPNNIALKQQEQHHAGNLNRNENDNCCGPEQTKTK
jgi:hypothetical protein